MAAGSHWRFGTRRIRPLRRRRWRRLAQSGGSSAIGADGFARPAGLATLGTPFRCTRRDAAVRALWMRSRPFSQSRRMRPSGSAAQRESTTTSTARPWLKRPTSAANKGGKRATSPLRSDHISTAQRERRSDESGVVGLEVLPLLVVVFVVGTLVFAQSWMALDAKIAATAGAREGRSNLR